MENRAASSYAEIAKCLTIGKQRSFLLPAGAGAGKTTALITAIESALELNKASLFLTGAQIAAITYTRAAADEILRRLENDPRVWVSTIHSFAWEMIKAHPIAIRDTLIAQITKKLEVEQDKRKTERSATTPTARARMRSINRNRLRLEELPFTRKFSYSPDSATPGRGSLGHSEVVDVFADLLSKKPLLRSFLASRFPILFIDEAQDTTKSLLPHFINITRSHNTKFTLGLFGDTMQRVYLDGVQNLKSDIPEHWAAIPPLDVNYRSDQRIVELANKIRSQEANDYEQEPYSKEAGTVRFFSLPRSSAGYETERLVQKFMANATNDSGWVHSNNNSGPHLVKTLVLEHRFAAERLGFLDFYDAMSGPATKEQMFGREDTWPPLVRFLDEVTTFVRHIQDQNFRKADRQLAKIRSGQTNANPYAQEATTMAESKTLSGALRQSAQLFKSLIESEENPTLGYVLQSIRTSEVFLLTEEAEESLLYFTNPSESPTSSHSSDTAEHQAQEHVQEELEAWNAVLALSLDQFASYLSYRKGTSGFDTQQGVKGLEFPRVLVVLNDDEARGKLFQFDKLVLDKDLSPADKKNLAEGKDTGPSRARRLFYVSCSRAEHALAIVHYGDVAPLGKEFRELFRAEEIVSWEQLLVGVKEGTPSQGV